MKPNKKRKKSAKEMESEREDGRIIKKKGDTRKEEKGRKKTKERN